MAKEEVGEASEEEDYHWNDLNGLCCHSGGNLGKN